jgi:probable rRNA maturation factor
VRVSFSGRRALAGKRRAALAALLARILDEHGEEGAVSIAFVGDAEIRKLHLDFLGKDQATDVLSFPLAEPAEAGPGRLAGEVVVSVDTARREAARRGRRLEDELALYAVHGVLHLVGYDDREPAARRRMRRAERRYLRSQTIQPPPRRRSPS